MESHIPILSHRPQSLLLVMGSKDLYGFRKKLLRIYMMKHNFKLILLLGLAFLTSCQTATSASVTTTTQASQATFGELPLWSSFFGTKGYWAVVYVDPYWVSYYSGDNGKHWVLKTPTGVSPRHGIAISESSAGEMAVGFFAYAEQRNSTIIEFGTQGLKPPVFLPGSLVESPQAISITDSGLYALKGSRDRVQILRTSNLGAVWKTEATRKASINLGQSSSIGFDKAATQNGVALLGPLVSRGILVGAYTTDNGGLSWTPIKNVKIQGSHQVIASFVPKTFASHSFEFSVSYTVGQTFQTVVVTPNTTTAPLATLNPPVVGGDNQGDIAVVNNTLGQPSTLAWFHASTQAFTPAVAMSGLLGVVETIAFSSLSQGVAITNNGGNLEVYGTSNGGQSWSKISAISPVLQTG